MLNQFYNYLNSQGIVPLQNNCTYSSTNPLEWQNGQYRFTNNLRFVTSRDILYSTACKYMEKVTFNTNGNNFAVAIGYNPASNSTTTIDKTNYLISSHFFNQRYDGYYLFNMYPDITPTKIRKNSSVLGNYIDIVFSFLNGYAHINSHDVFIFWGSSVYLSNNVINQINQLKKQCQAFYTFGVGGTHHQHPGRGVAPNTICHYNAITTPLGNGIHYLR